MRRSRLIPLVLALTSALPACSVTAATANPSVTVLASWTGLEQQQFTRVLREFTERTGIEVRYQGTRALDQVLAADVQRGTPPDIAALPSPNDLASYARRGNLYSLRGVVEPNGRDYGRQWLDLDRMGTEDFYAVPLKADLKGLVWYNPRQFGEDRPQTWEDLVDLTRSPKNASAAWCEGMGASSTSGWPGTDWIEDILLHQAGSRTYQQWAEGRLAWTAPEVRQAWQSWGDLARHGVRGGLDAALLTDFGDAGRGLFTNPPGCLLHHQASFITSNYQSYPASPRRGEDFDYFRLPVSQPNQPEWTVSADFAGLFRDSPQARRLLRFLISEQGQRSWHGTPGSSAFSLHREVGPATYHDAVSRRIAGTLTSHDTLCVDASDLMPATMRDAFYRAVLEYLNAPERLDSLLASLDRVRVSAAEEEWMSAGCGSR